MNKHAPCQAVGTDINPALRAANVMDNRVCNTRWHDARVTVWTHGVRMARVHPIVEERLLRLALRLALVAPPQDVHWSRRVELVGKVAAHFGLVRALVAHDQHLTTKAVRSNEE